MLAPKPLLQQWQDELMELLQLTSAKWNGRAWVDENDLEYPSGVQNSHCRRNGRNDRARRAASFLASAPISTSREPRPSYPTTDSGFTRLGLIATDRAQAFATGQALADCLCDDSGIGDGAAALTGWLGGLGHGHLPGVEVTAYMAEPRES